MSETQASSTTPSPPPAEAAESRPVSCWRGRLHRWLNRLACGLALLLAAWVFRAPILRGTANAWIVHEPLTNADAIVVLGGGAQTRPFEAARLYHAGYAPVILMMNTETRPTDEAGLTLSETELVRRVLLKQGVPEKAIVPLGQDISSTFEEGEAVRQWALQTRARRVIVPTEIFHTRRVHRFFTRLLRPVGTDVRVRALESKEYSADNWWQHEGSLIGFQNEVVKTLYYWFKY